MLAFQLGIGPGEAERGRQRRKRKMRRQAQLCISRSEHKRDHAPKHARGKDGRSRRRGAKRCCSLRGQMGNNGDFKFALCKSHCTLSKKSHSTRNGVAATQRKTCVELFLLRRILGHPFETELRASLHAARLRLASGRIKKRVITASRSQGKSRSNQHSGRR